MLNYERMKWRLSRNRHVRSNAVRRSIVQASLLSPGRGELRERCLTQRRDGTRMKRMTRIFTDGFISTKPRKGYPPVFVVGRLGISLAGAQSAQRKASHAKAPRRKAKALKMQVQVKTPGTSQVPGVWVFSIAGAWCFQWCPALE